MIRIDNKTNYKRRDSIIEENKRAKRQKVHSPPFHPLTIFQGERRAEDAVSISKNVTIHQPAHTEKRKSLRHAVRLIWDL